MKRIIVLLLSVVAILAVGLMLLACAPKAAPAPAPTPTPTPAPQTSEPIKLRFAYWQPMTCTFAVETFDPWVKTIEERTNGRVDIEVLGAGAIGNQFEVYDMCTAGAVDIHSIGWAPRFLTTEVIQLPFLMPSSTVASLVANDIGLKYSQKYDFADQKVLWLFTNAPYEICSNKKQIRTMEDWKGMKVVAQGGAYSDMITLLGGSPVVLSSPEAYQGLESGLVDMALLEWEGQWAWKWALVTKYRTVVPKSITLYTMGMAMNLDKWNSLPPDIQKIFEEESGAKWAYVAGEGMDRWNRNNYNDIVEYDKAAGNPLPYYTLPADELDRWANVVSPVVDTWLKATAEKGIPGQQILDEAKSLAEKYTAQYPPVPF